MNNTRPSVQATSALPHLVDSQEEFIFRNTAPRYYAKGLPVIPLYPKDKRPVPLNWQRFHDSLPTPDEQAEWTQTSGHCNIGLVLGRQSGISCIDIDTDDENLIRAILAVLPRSPWSRIGSKGMAIAYRFNDVPTFRIKDAVTGAMLVEHLSTKNQLVLPPSIHPKTQRPYESNSDLLNVIGDLPLIPTNIEGILREALKEKGIEINAAAGRHIVAKYTGHGGRDDAMIKNAGFFAGAVLRGDCCLLKAMEDLQAWYDTCIEKVEGDDIDIDKGIQALVKFIARDIERGRLLPTGWDSGLSEDEKQSLGFKEEDVDFNYNCSDYGIAEALEDRFRGDFRCVGKTWYLYCDGVWAPDAGMEREAVYRQIVEEVGAKLYRVIQKLNRAKGDPMQERLLNNKLQELAAMQAFVQRRSTKDNAFNYAKGFSGIVLPSSSMFDAKPNLFNVANGTLDLEDGTLLDHDREHLLTKKSPIAYDEEAECPRFEGFMSDIMLNDPEMVGFMQRLLGYALLDGNPAQVFPIFYGPTAANGKSTLLSVLAHVLGPYATTAPATTFLATNNKNEARNDLAVLKGARLVTTSELPGNARLDADLIKRVTGGDKISARLLYDNFGEGASHSAAGSESYR